MSAKANIRKILDLLCRNDEDMDALCIDHFPNIFTKFSQGMNRIQKINLLLWNAEENLIQKSLELTYGKQYTRLASPAESLGFSKEHITEDAVRRALRAVYIDELCDELNLPPSEATAIALRSISARQGVATHGNQISFEGLVQRFCEAANEVPVSDGQQDGQSSYTEQRQAFSREKLLETENQQLKVLVAELYVENRALRKKLRDPK